MFGSSLPSVELPLSQIRFAQCSVCEEFSGGHGPITRRRDELLALYLDSGGRDGGDRAVNEWFHAQGAVIKVAEHPPGQMKYWTMDNRRLWCVKSVCAKAGVDEQDFRLRVLLETKAQQEKRGRDGRRDEMESKYSTCNDGRSVVVQTRGRGANAARYGGDVRELVFQAPSEAAWRMLRDDAALRHQLMDRHHLMRL